MSISAPWQGLAEELDRWREEGLVARLWLRDDDAVVPSTALDRLLDLTRRHDVPVALAIIPALSGETLAIRLAEARNATPVVHGWSHTNHAPPSEKKQELGPHRPRAEVLSEMSAALRRMQSLYGSRLFPLLVPPWNRIEPTLLPSLAPIGYVAVSGFRNTPAPGDIQVINTHVDIIDWHGTRGGRDPAVLVGELTEHLKAARSNGEPIGILGHHLDHDELCWSFLERLFACTKEHPACRWCQAASLIS